MSFGKIIQKGFGIITAILCVMMIMLYSYLFILNLIGTTTIDITLNGYKEYAKYSITKPILTTLLFGVMLILTYFVYRSELFEKINSDKLKRTVFWIIVMVGIFWVMVTRGTPIGDQLIVSNAASDFINGNYDMMNLGEYLSRFPHQFGIVFIFELIYKIFGTSNYQVIMIINAFCSAGIFLNIYGILKDLIDNNKVLNCYAIFSAMYFVLPFYSFFVYGTLIGLYFATMSLRFVTKIHKMDEVISLKKIIYFIIALLVLGIAVISKSNYSIFVIALVISFTFASIKGKKYLNVIFSVLLVLSIAGPSLVCNYYEKVSGKEIYKGAPKSLYVAMGLQEGKMDRGCGTNGWYNAYNVGVLGETEYDFDKADEIAQENIKERIEDFKKHPKKIIPFFNSKAATQWCEPSQQVFWMISVNDNHGDLSKFASNLLTGKIRKNFTVYFRYLLLLILAGNIFFYIRSFKRKDFLIFVFGIYVIGGFLFHEVWEAKALYIFTYLLLSVPCGIIGLNYFFDFINKKKIKASKEIISK